jgi:ribosomal protein S27E
MVAGALVGVHVIHTERLGEIMGQYAVSDRDYEMQGLPGQAVLELLDLPAQDAIKWLTAMRKEMAKMNLQPHQALCLECGEIYAKSLAGPSAEGFCSRLCRNVHAKKSAPPPAPAVKGPREEPVKVTCPKCNRPVKIGRTASGKPRKCVWCGEPLAPPA